MNKQISKKRKVLLIISAIVLSGVIVSFFLEIFLRTVPIPGINYNTTKYDTLTSWDYYPNTTNIYINDRGDYVKRKINNYGYYDKDFQKKKGKNIARIGFFGDSYTAARQVKLEQTFHYLIEDSLKKYGVETLSFGVDGYSTFQSYLTYKKWGDYFSLDVVVYDFFENDLGDQIKVIRQEESVYPKLVNGKLIVDNFFRVQRKNRLTTTYKIFDYLTSKSIVLATLSDRLHLLLKYGIKLKVTKAERYMTKTDTNSIIKYPPYLNQGDVPSIWPDSLKQAAIKLEEFILLKWQREVEEKGRRFIIIYNPTDIEHPTDKQDTWKPWLFNFCKENNITIIDPTDNLFLMKKSGYEVFYDHYTKYGHIAVANKFINYYKNHYINN